MGGKFLDKCFKTWYNTYVCPAARRYAPRDKIKKRKQTTIMSKRYSNKGANAAIREREAAAAAAASRRQTTIVAAIAIGILAVVIIIAVVVASLPKQGEADMAAITAEINSMALTDFTETDKTTDYVRITVKNHGDIVLRLREDIAPKTVKNFKKLVAEDFYDGLTFHRVMKGFMIQGGDPKVDGSGNSAATIKGEFSSNGVRNDLSHIKGVISMARSNAMDSASCQFFICNSNASASLDTKYAGFGYVVAGLETVDSISAIEVKANTSGENSVPVAPVIIERITFVQKTA